MRSKGRQQIASAGECLANMHATSTADDLSELVKQARSRPGSSSTHVHFSRYLDLMLNYTARHLQLVSRFIAPHSTSAPSASLLYSMERGASTLTAFYGFRSSAAAMTSVLSGTPRRPAGVSPLQILPVVQFGLVSCLVLLRYLSFQESPDQEDGGSQDRCPAVCQLGIGAVHEHICSLWNISLRDHFQW